MADRSLERGARPRPRGDTAARRHSQVAPSPGPEPLPPIATELDRRHVGLSLAIRECQPGDAAKLEWMGLLPAQRASLDEAYARHARGEEMLLVAESQGFPVALVRIAFPEGGDARESAASIAALRVMPGLQGLGLGTALMAAAERVVRERGRAAIEIAVASSDAKSVARYVRLGYAADEQSDDGRTVLRKLLDPGAARPLQRTAR